MVALIKLLLEIGSKLCAPALGLSFGKAFALTRYLDKGFPIRSGHEFSGHVAISLSDWRLLSFHDFSSGVFKGRSALTARFNFLIF
jgi:hypothetical protein